MSVHARSYDPTADPGRAPELEWIDGSGARWSATLIQHPPRPTDEREIQIDGDDGMPERVLCFGMAETSFHSLSVEQLELLRRAAQARRGIVWMDSRDEELWWVEQQSRERWQFQLRYSSPRWRGTTALKRGVPLTLMADREHQELLDDARARAEIPVRRTG